MENKDSIRDRLLEHLPQPANLAAYREEVASTLEKNEKGLRHQRWVTGALLVYAVAFVIVPLSLNWLRLDSAKGAIYAFTAFVVYLYAMVEVLKMFINRNRVEILKEVKQVQLQVVELQASLRKDGAE